MSNVKQHKGKNMSENMCITERIEVNALLGVIDKANKDLTKLEKEADKGLATLSRVSEAQDRTSDTLDSIIAEATALAVELNIPLPNMKISRKSTD